jgi:hypothetical protein
MTVAAKPAISIRLATRYPPFRCISEINRVDRPFVWLNLTPSRNIGVQSPLEEPDLPPRPDTNEVSEIIRKLSAIDRSLLRDISLKYLKVLHLEAKIEVEKRQTTEATPLPENDFNNRDNLDCGFDNELPSIIPTTPTV